MIPKLERTRIKRELRELADEYRRSYEDLQQTSEAKYKTTLQAGAVFHPQKGFYYEEDRQAFQKKSASLRKKAHDIVDKATLEVMAQNTAAPSAEAVNMLAVLNARKDVSANEIDQLMTVYGHDCPMIYKALREKAQELGYHDFKPHPVTEEAEGLEDISRGIDRAFNSIEAERNIDTAMGGFEATLLNTLPEA